MPRFLDEVGLGSAVRVVVACAATVLLVAGAMGCNSGAADAQADGAPAAEG